MGKRMWATLLRTKASRRTKAFGLTKTLPVAKKMLGESVRGAKVGAVRRWRNDA